MTKEDILRMARQAGLHLATDVNWMPVIDFEYAEKFAALLLAAEREACAELCERMARRTEDIRRAALEVAAENIRARGNT